MRLIFFTDGSDDGFTATRLVATLIDPTVVSYIAVVAITWPERPSPIWDKAFEAHLALDDLHRSMAVIADQCVKRLRAELTRHAAVIKEIITAGEPAQATLDILQDVRVDVGFIAVTSGTAPRSRRGMGFRGHETSALPDCGDARITRERCP